MELIGGRVVLKDKTIEDAWMDYLWRSDEEISRLDAAYPLRMKYEEFLRFFQDQLRYPTPSSARFGIHTRDGKYIGNCMYYDMNTIDKEAEIGIVIGDRNYWSRGYGYDALVSIMDYLFAQTSVQRLYLHTLNWNKRALRSFEKCGLSPVRSVRRNGMSFVLMEMKKDQWLEIREQKLAARDAEAQRSKK